MRLNVGDEKSQRPPSQPVSPHGAQGYSGPKIPETFENLSIGQNTFGECSSGNALKRSAVKDGSLDEHSRLVKEERMSPRTRKVRTSGPHLGTSDEGVRSKKAAPGRLYDHVNDAIAFGHSGENAKGHSTLLSGHGVQPRFNDDPTLKEPKIEARPAAQPPEERRDRPVVKPPDMDQSPTDQTEPMDASYDTEPEQLLLQPETRPVPYDQLVDEVKGIYGGLVMVEAKCIEVDDKQTLAAQERDPSRQTRLTLEQYSALIALHKTLLNEHHDFFLATQHPSATPALRRLPAKYSIPARMWRHGIHAFLEVLRFRLPDSLDHMLAFIYIAYSMMALLYETVPTFEDTWIESLGDLGRYRMAIEDDDITDRENWSGVAKSWYRKAVDRNPKV